MRQALVGIVPSEILQRKRKAFRCASLHDLVRRGLADTARSFPSLPQPPPVYRQPVYKQRRILTSACCQHSWAIFKPHSVELYYQQIGFCALKQRGCSGRNAAYSNYRLSLPRSQSARPTAKKAVFHAVTSRIKPRRVTSVPLVDERLKLRTTNKPPLLNAQTSVRKSYSISRLSECRDGAGPRPVEFASHGPGREARRVG
jgi:hypothetical protein